MTAVLCKIFKKNKCFEVRQKSFRMIEDDDSLDYLIFYIFKNKVNLIGLDTEFLSRIGEL